MQGDPLTRFQGVLKTLGYWTDNRELLQELWSMVDDMEHMKTEHVPALLLDGPPGIGKTHGARTFAKVLSTMKGVDVPLHKVQFVPGLGKDELMSQVNIAAIIEAQKNDDIHVPAKDLMLPGFLHKALELSQRGPVVVLIDELDKAKASVDAFLLEFLNSCSISDAVFGTIEGNPRNMAVFATKNDMREVTGPLGRRMRHLVLTWPAYDTEWRLVKQLALDAFGGRRIHGNIDTVCQQLVRLANKVRVHAKKMQATPSTPELARAVTDCMRQRNRDTWPSIWRRALVLYKNDQFVLGDMLEDINLLPYIRLC